MYKLKLWTKLNTYYSESSYNYAVASPAPKKVGGLNHVSSLVSSKSYNIHTWGTPLYVKKLFNGFAHNPKRGLNRSGGVRTHPFPPWRRHWYYVYTPRNFKIIDPEILKMVSGTRKLGNSSMNWVFLSPGRGSCAFLGIDGDWFQRNFFPSIEFFITDDAIFQFKFERLVCLFFNQNDLEQEIPLQTMKVQPAIALLIAKREYVIHK